MNRTSECAFMYGAGRLVLLHASSQAEESFFGGPCELMIDKRSDNVCLHRTLTIRGSQLPTSEGGIVGSISLLYAFRYSQNKISYGFSGSDIPGQGVWLDETSIRDLVLDEGTYLENWPYKHYPPIFPLTNLWAEDAGVITQEALRERYDLQQASWDPCDVLVGVPTNRTMGFSMWGLEGDKQGIVLLFTIDLRQLRVAAWHTLP